jgi:hypothetical protein
MFPLVNGQLTGPTAVSSETYNFPGANPSISANGNTQGIIWTIDSEAFDTPTDPLLLQAHSATDPATTLYSSSTNASRDNPGPAVKFSVPTVANGKVYVGAQYLISIFGLLGGEQSAASPQMSPGAESFAGSLTVSITDATAGATIYYTLDGSTPTVSSAVYTTSITIAATTTIQAIAIATGYFQSAVTSEAYVGSLQVSAPTFSQAGGTYSTPQSVAISDTTAGAAIYYTTNGTTPTTSSTKYTTALAVSATETLEAIAVAAGYANSPVTTATYTISTGSTGYIDYPLTGFTASSLSLNYGATVTSGLLQLTDGGAAEERSAWFTTRVPVQSFITDFTFQQLNASADGLTFAIQGNNIWSLGDPGGGLGYEGIPASVAIKFDLYNNAGEGINSTGIYTNGAAPTVPAVNLSTTAINLHSEDIMHAHMVYDGTNLTMTLTDTVTNATVTDVFPVNIPGIVGGNTAFVGFTASTGSTTATQNVLSWTYVSPAGNLVAVPAFIPTGGSYATSQTVSISDATSGATIYYTTNGTTPTTSSSVYSSAIAVSATETVQAFAAVAGDTSSSLATAAYTIASTALPAPTFSPTGGTYSTSQTVTISDTTSGAAIYYTTNGTTPTASSTKYSGAVTVNATETLDAFAVETGDANSPTVTATYTISTGGTSFIDYPVTGFTAGSLSLNSGATVTGGLLQLTDGGAAEERSAWFTTKVSVQSFITDFTFQQLNASADGMTFAIQGNNIWSLGDPGGGLGYEGIANSVAVKFDLYNNAGEGIDSTGLYTDGVAPTVPAVNLSTTAINLHSGDVMHAHMVYDGTNLTMILTDTVTNATVTEVFPVNIPGIVGGNTAYVGFTGSTGSTTATQDVLSWTYASQ